MDYKVCEILIVEDNPNDAELMLRTLRKNHVANEIVVVEDGEEALDFLFRMGENDEKTGYLPPKVIFLDLNLPKVDGLEVLRCLKSDSKTKKIPVVIISSSKENPDIETAYDIGANSYVVKPVDIEEFVGTLSQIGMYWLAVNQKPQ